MKKLAVVYPMLFDGVKYDIHVFDAILTKMEYNEVKHRRFHTNKHRQCIACAEFGQLEKYFKRKIKRISYE